MKAIISLHKITICAYDFVLWIVLSLFFNFVSFCTANWFSPSCYLFGENKHTTLCVWDKWLADMQTTVMFFQWEGGICAAFGEAGRGQPPGGLWNIAARVLEPELHLLIINAVFGFRLPQVPQIGLWDTDRNLRPNVPSTKSLQFDELPLAAIFRLVVKGEGWATLYMDIFISFSHSCLDAMWETNTWLVR